MDSHFRKRMRRRLYYGDSASMQTPSLPMTELSVEYFKDAVSQKLGHVELETASDLIRRNRVSPCSMVLSMMYAKRLKQKKKDYIYAMSSSDVFFISMMMASKYLYDEGVDEEVFNDDWADSTNQEVEDVNELEMDFLKAIDWQLFVRPEEFDDALAAIERRLALQEGLKRGWFTYSELAVLADANLMAGLWSQLGLQCYKVTAMLMAAYTTSLLSMLGSTALAFQFAGPMSTATVALLSVTPSILPAISNCHACDSALASNMLEKRNCSSRLGNHAHEPGWGPNCWQGVDHESACLGPEESLTDGSPVVVGGGSQGDSISWGSAEAYEAESQENVEHGQLKSSPDSGDDTRSQPSPRGHSTSLWSLVFLDSLLTQLWAVGSTRRASHSSNTSNGSPHQNQSCRRRQRLSLSQGSSETTQDEVIQPDTTFVQGLYADDIYEGNNGDAVSDQLGFYKASFPSKPNPCLALKQLPFSANQRPNLSCDTNLLAPRHSPPHTHDIKHSICSPRVSDEGPLDPAWPRSSFGDLSTPELSATIVHIPNGFHTSIPYIVQAT